MKKKEFQDILISNYDFSTDDCFRHEVEREFHCGNITYADIIVDNFEFDELPVTYARYNWRTGEALEEKTFKTLELAYAFVQQLEPPDDVVTLEDEDDHKSCPEYGQSGHRL